MRLLQKYILVELIRVFVFVVSVLTVLLVFVGAFGQISENNLGPAQLLEILPYLVPSLLPYTIPATMLLTVTVVYGRVAADHEITAAKAAGISAMSLLWPSYIMAAVLSVVSLLLTDQVIPWALTNIERRVAQMMETIFLDILHSQKVYIHRDPSLQINVADVEGKKLIQPLFRYTPRGGSTMNVSAAEATIHFNLEKRVVEVGLTDFNLEIPDRQNFRNCEHEVFTFPLPADPPRLKTMNCSIHELRKNLTGTETNLEKRRNERDIETAFSLATGDFDRLHATELLQYDIDLQNNQEDIARIYTDIHKRFALSASCFFFAFLGAPFSVLQARRQVLTSFFMCFLPILLLYYPIALLMMDQSKSGVLNPAWAMWTGNAILVPFALTTLRKVLKH
jgi:lipopolysaccharide export system permease protein